MHLFVGSTNPVKINAVTVAVGQTWPEATIQGFEVPSGVGEQPRSDEETRIGAQNRARGAFKLGQEKLSQLEQPPRQDLNPNQVLSSFQALSPNQAPHPDQVLYSDQAPHPSQMLAVGLEGGVFTHQHGELWSTVWVAVTDYTGHFYESNGARFPVPTIIANLIQQGGEMGPVVSQLVGRQDVRQGQGMIGVITGSFVNRTEEYSGIAKMALGLWYGRNCHTRLKM